MGSTIKIPLKEKNNHMQGRSGSKVKITNGPATGSKLGGKAKGRSAWTKNSTHGKSSGY